MPCSPACRHIFLLQPSLSLSVCLKHPASRPPQCLRRPLARTRRAVFAGLSCPQTLLKQASSQVHCSRWKLNDKDKINHCQVIAAKSTTEDDLAYDKMSLYTGLMARVSCTVYWTRCSWKNDATRPGLFTTVMKGQRTSYRYGLR